MMFTGSIVAIVTPMHANGEIDFEGLERLVDWHIKSGTDGLVVLGTTGESATIESDERKKIIAQSVRQVKGVMPVIVGTGVNSTSHSIELTREAMEMGADAALLVTPYYNKPTQEGLFQHYRAIAKAVPIPQILYNVPSRTACDLLPETVKRLSEYPNIVAIKEATGDIERLKQLLALNSSMDMLSGDDSTAMEFMLAGGRGVISVVANVVPTLFHDLCKAAVNGDRVAATKINDQLKMLYKGLFAESNPIPTKWALGEMGLIESGIRLPLTPLDSKFYTSVRSAMQQAEVPMPVRGV